MRKTESTVSDLAAVFPVSGREATPPRPTSFSFKAFKDCIMWSTPSWCLRSLISNSKWSSWGNLPEELATSLWTTAGSTVMESPFRLSCKEIFSRRSHGVNFAPRGYLLTTQVKTPALKFPPNLYKQGQSRLNSAIKGNSLEKNHKWTQKANITATHWPGSTKGRTDYLCPLLGLYTVQ